MSSNEVASLDENRNYPTTVCESLPHRIFKKSRLTV
jgi:hypothetical protein